jgi:hypothetical protein
MERSSCAIVALATLMVSYGIASPVFVGAATMMVAQASSPTPATPPDGAAYLKAPHETPAAENRDLVRSCIESKKRQHELIGAGLLDARCRCKTSGKLNGRQWADFRREECGEKDIEAVFAAAVAPKYSGEDLDKARTYTSADQFAANKASNPNGGMRWVDKDAAIMPSASLA